MNRWLRYLLIALLAIGLLLVRHFETDLFYDPFISFFKGEYFNFFLPEFTWSSLIYSLGFRFGLNTILSLAILYLIFKDRGIVKAASAIYAFCFCVLLVVLVIILANAQPSLTAIFYVRRFLIQPLLLLILIPAFYYHKIKN